VILFFDYERFLFMDLGEVVIQIVINHPVFLLLFTQIYPQQESTPPESGGETFTAHF
jgi:hypothetical protein